MTAWKNYLLSPHFKENAIQLGVEAFITVVNGSSSTQNANTQEDSHRTGTTEVVQTIKSVEENIEDNKEMKLWAQTMYLYRK